VTDAIYPYHRGGKETRTRHLAAGLAASGVEVHVFTMRWWQGSRHRVEDGVHYHGLCRVYPLYSGDRRSVLEAVMFAVACLRLVTFRCDVIEADHMPHLQLFTIRLVAWLRHVPLVSTWHEYWGLDYWRQYLGPLGFVAAAIEQATMRLPDRLVTPSPETADRLVARGRPSGAVTVVPNGIDLAVIDAAAPGELGADLVYVGRLIAHKHVDHLLAAVAALAGDGVADRDPSSPGAGPTCVIVGDGPERQHLEQDAVRLGIADRVRFLGVLESESEVFGVMKASKVFVLPSVREGFGIVVAEAMACGLPVVTTRHPDNHARSLVVDGSTGWLCEPTAESLAGVLAAVLDLGSGDRVAGRLAAERFAWGASVDALVAVFESSCTAELGASAA
jgi:glycosyltransferase involved in cell wall biosynthesis